MKNTKLDGRLFSASKFVRQGAIFADVGTDHAYLPLFLLKEGRIERAVCSDINEGPLNSARENAREAGFFENISFYLTDGARELSALGITDMAICGMGGELIASIIDNAPYLKDKSVNLILQPMSRQEHLRAYLYSHGFEVIDEAYSEDSGKFYVTLLASFVGKERTLSEEEAIFSTLLHKDKLTDSEKGYLKKKSEALKKVMLGKKLSGKDSSEDEKIIKIAEELLTK